MDIYNNVERKRFWGKRNEPPLVIPKADLHPKKVTLCVWWDWKGILLWAFTKQRDDKFKEVLFLIRRIEDSNWTKTSRNSESYFIRTIRSHVSLITRQKLLDLSCSTPSTIFIRPRALWFSPISIITKFP